MPTKVAPKHGAAHVEPSVVGGDGHEDGNHLQAKAAISARICSHRIRHPVLIGSTTALPPAPITRHTRPCRPAMAALTKMATVYMAPMAKPKPAQSRRR